MYHRYYNTAKTVVSETTINAKPVIIKWLKIIISILIIVFAIAASIEFAQDFAREKAYEEEIQRFEQERESEIEQADRFMNMGQYGSAYDIYQNIMTGPSRPMINMPYLPIGIDIVNKAAYCLLMMDKYQDAIDLYAHETNLNSQSYIIMSNAYSKLGNKSKAIKNAQEACARGDCSLSQQFGVK